MRRIMVALLCAIVAGIMLVPSGVSAGTKTIVVSDRTGDLGIFWNFDTCEATSLWGQGTPWVQAGYFDMTSVWLSQKGTTYTFGMELSKELPREGSPLPSGVDFACWLIWIDPAPWNALYNPIDTLFTIGLTYDGSKYAAALMEGVNGNIIAPLPFTIDGSKFQVQFSAASIGNLPSFWWMPATKIWWGDMHAWDSIDRADPGAGPGQVWWDLPWPPV